MSTQLSKCQKKADAWLRCLLQRLLNMAWALHLQSYGRPPREPSSVKAQCHPLTTNEPVWGSRTPKQIRMGKVKSPSSIKPVFCIVGWSASYGINMLHTQYFAFIFSIFARLLWWLAKEVNVRRNVMKYSFLLLRKFRERQEEGTKCEIKTRRCVLFVSFAFL